VKFLSEKKETLKNEKKEIAVSKKKAPATVRPRKKPTALAPSTPFDLWLGFDEAFERFRKDFQNLLLPSSRALEKVLTALPETRVPVVDLQDRGKDYLLKAEMPGFKKEDIEIQAYEDAVEISGTAGWKYDKKKERYICKERACETFYRMVQLPEEIKVDDVVADLKDGVLEITMKKKAPKQSKKITLK
jgi:HSP20 family protein